MRRLAPFLCATMVAVLCMSCTAGRVRLEPFSAGTPERSDAITLEAIDAEIMGGCKKDKRGRFIGWWYQTDAEVTWPGVEVPPGEYKVTLVYATPNEGKIAVSIDNQVKHVPITKTGTYGNYRRMKIGRVRVSHSHFDVKVITLEVTGEGLMDLKSIVLTPTGKS